MSFWSKFFNFFFTISLLKYFYFFSKKKTNEIASSDSPNELTSVKVDDFEKLQILGEGAFGKVLQFFSFFHFLNFTQIRLY